MSQRLLAWRVKLTSGAVFQWGSRQTHPSSLDGTGCGGWLGVTVSNLLVNIRQDSYKSIIKNLFYIWEDLCYLEYAK